MKIVIENWFYIVCVVAVLVSAILAIFKFVKSGSAKQLDNVLQWLVYATSLAEKELGSGTGRLKLRWVYDQFLVKFPWLARVISFDTFSILVDKALKQTNSLLESNSAIRDFVKGKENDKEEGR